MKRRAARGAALLLAAAIAAAVCLLLIGAETRLWGLVAGFALSALPVPVYVALALWLDRFEAEPVGLLARAFAWGALVAVPLSLLVNAAVEIGTGSPLFATLLSAPVVEEVTKAAVLFHLFHTERHEFDNVTDGVVYATMVGLGFAMTENVLFYGAALARGDAADVFMLRALVAPFAHPLFTAMTGIGLGWARESLRRELRPAAAVGGLAAAVVLHALWNLSARFDPWFGAVYVLLMLPAFVAVLLAVRRSLRREAEVIREQLAPLVADGVLTEAELRRLCTIRHRLGATWEALLHRGAGPWRERRRYHQTASELAFLRWRAARGMREAAAGEWEEECVEELRRFLARYEQAPG
ncbi:hypothetical protein BH20GEM2_BH20GEM2_22050 [soil metagenome]